METITKIKKAKLPKDGEKFHVTFTRKGPSDKTAAIVNEDYEDEPHADLFKAFEKFKIHLAVLCGYIKAADVDPEAPTEEQTERFYCSSFSVGKNEDKPGVVISGSFRGPYGHVTLNSPFVRFDVSEESSYVFLEDLQKNLEVTAGEILKYLFEAKRADPAQPNEEEDGLKQLDLFNTEEPVTKIIIDHPEDAYAGSPEAIVGSIVNETNAGKEEPKQDKPKKAARVKKVPQSNANPSGEVVEAD